MGTKVTPADGSSPYYTWRSYDQVYEATQQIAHQIL